MTALINPERTMRQQRICAACALRSRGLQGAEAGRLLIAAGTPRRIEAFLLPYARHMRAAGWRVDALANGARASAVLQDEFSSVHDIDWSRSPFDRSEEHTSELQSRGHLVCRLLLEKK